MDSNPKPSLPFRSISDIMAPYRNFFHDIHFRCVLSALISREEFLTRDLKIQSVRLERELRQLRRELNAFKDREAGGIRVLELEKHELCSKLEILQSCSIECNDRIKGLIRDVDEKNEEISRLVEKLNDIRVGNERTGVLLGEFKGVVLKVEVLEKEKSEIEVKLDEFRRENECLVADKVKSDEELRKLESVFVGIKDEIEGLMRILGEKNKEICGKDERIEVLMRKVEVLEKEKRENKAKFDEIQRENESLVTAVEKEVKIDELKKKIEGLEVEKIELMKENEVLSRNYEKMEQQVVKLEEDVARLLLGNVSNPNKLTDDQIEKVLSCVFNGCDSEEDGGMNEIEKIQRGAPVASSSKPAVDTTSGFVTEVPRETKRQRVLSQCSNQKHQFDHTSDKSEVIAACRRSRRLRL